VLSADPCDAAELNIADIAAIDKVKVMALLRPNKSPKYPMDNCPKIAPVKTTAEAVDATHDACLPCLHLSSSVVQTAEVISNSATAIA
jgi:hypothetical protein